MRKIVENNPENTKNYLKPDNKKMLLIMVGIKLAFAAVGAFMIPAADYPGFAMFLLRLLMFAFVYDICCLYQVSLHIAQSYLIAFLLFLLLLMGGVFVFNHFFGFLAQINPATEAGQNASMAVMGLIFFIPFIIDVIRLIKLPASPPSDGSNR